MVDQIESSRKGFSYNFFIRLIKLVQKMFSEELSEHIIKQLFAFEQYIGGSLL